MKLIQKIKSFAFSKKLKTKMVRSHYFIAILGIIALSINLFLFYWLRTSTLSLFNVQLPVVQDIQGLKVGIQMSTSNLRGWISLGDVDFKKGRKAAWQAYIYPNLKKLKQALTSPPSMLEKQKQLELALHELDLWQWRIEDIARTPGNEPTKLLFYDYLEPLQNQILEMTANFIHLEKVKKKGGEKALFRKVIDLRDNLNSTFRAFQIYLFDNNDVALINTRLHAKKVRSNLDLVKSDADVMSHEQQAVFVRLEKHFYRYEEAMNKLIEMAHRPEDKNIALNWLANKAVPASKQASKLIDEISQVQYTEQLRQTKEIQFISNVVFVVLVFSVLLLLLASYVLASFQANRLIRSIFSLVTATKKMAEGSLSENVNVEEEDELGFLTKTFNQMRVQKEKESLKLEKAMDKLDELAHIDSLTHLANRFHFNEQAEKTLISKKMSLGNFALILIDLDKFKAVNDTLGHDAGDQLLKQFSARLKKQVRKTDLVARLGGDEFVLILRRVDTLEAAKRVAEGITEVMKKPFKINGKPLSAACSMGIALYPKSGKTISSLLKAADVQIYKAKKRK